MQTADATTPVHDRLIEFLTSRGVAFREIEHPPAATALDYSRLVGSALAAQAKALLLRRYRRSGGKDLVLHALPGDARADLAGLAGALDAKRLRLASAEEIGEATGCRVGELPAVGSVFGLESSMDARLLEHAEVYLGAGQLDRSVILSPHDLAAVDAPVIVQPAGSG